jgi:hypothetical protein
MVRNEAGKMEYFAGVNLIEAMRKKYSYTHPVMISSKKKPNELRLSVYILYPNATC